MKKNMLFQRGNLSIVRKKAIDSNYCIPDRCKKVYTGIKYSIITFYKNRKDSFSFKVEVYTLTFLFVFLLAFSPYLMSKTSFILNFDGRDQTYPWLAYLGIWGRKIISNFTNGIFAVPLYDLSIGWGTGTVSYLSTNGMMDPILFVFSSLIPTAYVEFLYNLLPLFYLYFSGIAFIYLCNYFKKDFVGSLIGSLIYVFNGFTIYYGLAFSMAVNFMCFFPLLVVGTERILRKEKSIKFTITVFLSAICGHYYRLYIMTLLLAIYATVRIILLYPNRKWVKELPSILIRGVCLYLLGIGLAAPIVFPAIFTFFGSTRTSSTRFIISRDFWIHWKYFWARFLSLAAPKTYYEWDWGLDYPAYPAISVFAFILLYTLKGKRTLKWLVGIALLMFFCPFFGWILNGMQYVCNRWSFALSLLAGYTVTELYSEMLEMNQRQRRICILFACFYGCLGFFFSSMRELVFTAVGVSFVFITLFLLVYSSITQKVNYKIVCLALVIVNICTNAFYMCSKESMGWVSWFLHIGDGTLQLASATEGEAAGYSYGNQGYEGRFDSTLFHYNDSMIYGIPGTLFYDSTINEYVSEFCKELEICDNVQDFKLHSTDQRTIVNELLSIKYQIEGSEKTPYIPYGYKKDITTISGKTVFKNLFALPFGYTYDNCISYSDLEDMNGVQKQEVLLQAVAIDNTLGSEIKPQSDIENNSYSYRCNGCSWKDGTLISESEDSSIELFVDLPAGKEHYIRLKGFDIEGYGDDFYTVSLSASFNIGVTCGNVFKYGRVMSKEYPWYYGRDNYLFCLGISNNDRNSIKIDIPAIGKFKLDEIEVLSLPLDNYSKKANALREESLENIIIGDNTISGEIQLSKEKILCLAIPYNKGWTAFVDGKKQEIERVNYAFCGLILPEGRHDILFVYMTPGLVEGLYTSVVCIIVLLWVIIYNKRKGFQLK